MGRGGEPLSNSQQSGYLKVVDFLGVPGVGKSFLVGKAVPKDTERPMDWFSQGSRMQRIRRKVFLILRHIPSAFVSVLWARKVIRLYQPMGWRRRWKVLFNWVFVDCLIREAARLQKSVLVLDQGIAQALWSTQFGAQDAFPGEAVPKVLLKYIADLPISEWSVINVTAPPEIILKRVEGREGFSPLDRNPSAIDEAQLAEREVHELLTGLARGVEAVPKINIVSIVNDGSDAVHRLRDVMGWPN